MRKDGSGLVARSRQTAEQEKAVREEWQEMEEDEPSEDNGSDSSYQGSTDSAKVRWRCSLALALFFVYTRYNGFVNPL
jgi:hypothetical protein